MRAAAMVLAIVFTSTQLLAQEQSRMSRAIEHAPAVALDQSSSASHRGAMFWSGLALGIAGATTSALGLTVDRVQDSSTGNAPRRTYQACVDQKSDPIYATNQCDALKGKNLKLLWGGVAVGAVGAALIVRSISVQAEVEPGAVSLVKRLRF